MQLLHVQICKLMKTLIFNISELFLIYEYALKYKSATYLLYKGRYGKRVKNKNN